MVAASIRLTRKLKHLQFEGNLGVFSIIKTKTVSFFRIDAAIGDNFQLIFESLRKNKLVRTLEIYGTKSIFPLQYFKFQF